MIGFLAVLMLLLCAAFLFAARKHKQTLQVSLLSRNAKNLIGLLFGFAAIVLLLGSLTGWKVKPMGKFGRLELKQDGFVSLTRIGSQLEST